MLAVKGDSFFRMIVVYTPTSDCGCLAFPNPKEIVAVIFSEPPPLRQRYHLSYVFCRTSLISLLNYVNTVDFFIQNMLKYLSKLIKNHIFVEVYSLMLEDGEALGEQPVFITIDGNMEAKSSYTLLMYLFMQTPNITKRMRMFRRAIFLTSFSTYISYK